VKEINNQKFLTFIDDYEKQDYDNIFMFLNDDIELAIIIAETAKNMPELRRRIIENLPDEQDTLKKKLSLLVNYDEENINEAFEILKEMDLTNLSYLECKPYLNIVHKKKAWDFEVIIIQKLLEKEEKEKSAFNLKLQLHSAYYELKKYPEVIEIGEELLKCDSEKYLLDKENREALLTNTILACFERGKIDNRGFQKSQEVLDKFTLAQPSFEFKAGIEAEVYINNNQHEKAFEALIQAVKIKKTLTAEEYAKLNFLISVKIGDRIKLTLETLRKVQNNTFVKLKDKDRWYYIGNENELDAIKITNSNEKYSIFNDKDHGAKLEFREKYSSVRRVEVIEKIYTIEQYIVWQIVQNFQNLAKDNILDWVKTIEIPENEGTINPKYLLEFFKDMHKGAKKFFQIYCNENIPFALLAVSEGGVVNALGRIQNENKGFIKFSDGTTKEFETQKSIARNIIDNKKPFYIDGTSALILAEIGMLEKVIAHLPNIRIPQSVISLLIDITARFTYSPSQTGRLGYSQGKIVYSPVDKGQSEFLKSRIAESISLLESKPENIIAISLSIKVDCFSEQEVPGELSDACILAQNDKLALMTEDYLYLLMNKIETKKDSPEYFSALALLKVLYEKSNISFNEYLDFVGYISSYRFRFIPLTSEDIENTVLGSGRIQIVNPENIRKLNFPLLLSEEYGVPFKHGFTFIGKFIVKFLFDDAIIPEIFEKVFIEIVESFPSKIDKKLLGLMFLQICILEATKERPGLIIRVKNKIIEEKIKRLNNATEIYNLY